MNTPQSTSAGPGRRALFDKPGGRLSAVFGRGDDTAANPHGAQIVPFELFELFLLLELDKQFPVEQFEATVSQSTVHSPPLMYGW